MNAGTWCFSESIKPLKPRPGGFSGDGGEVRSSCAADAVDEDFASKGPAGKRGIGTTNAVLGMSFFQAQGR